MKTSAFQEQGWLNDTATCLLFSRHLRATGHTIIREVQAGKFPPTFTHLLTQALREPGKLLASPIMQGEVLDRHALRGWTLPVLLTAVSASGTQAALLSNLSKPFWQRAACVAAAAEFLGTALDIIDDIQDGDSPFVQRTGMPFALNIGVAFLELAPLALKRARDAGWSHALADAALEHLHMGILRSLGGQFLDLRFEKMKNVTEAQIIEMVEKKSGTLLGFICRLGAMAGVAGEQERPPAYFEAVSLFGWHIGIWLQLLNDLHDAEEAQTQTRKSDRKRGKKTLPLALEGQGMIDNTHEEREEWSLNAQAAFSYTYVTAEVFRMRAAKALQALEEQYGPHPLLWPLLATHWEEEHT
jgi:geranylgeranyl pyrophosphate synthase